MKKCTREIIEQLYIKYPALSCCREQIAEAAEKLITCYENGHKVLACGNGGSAADSEHIVGELMKGFLINRTLPQTSQNSLRKMFPDTAEYLISNLQGALPAVSLVSQTALMTAFANDKAPDLAFAQQVLGYGQKGDVLVAISTSGSSKNVLYAAQIAKYQGVEVISLTGSTGGKLRDISDTLINVPSDVTFEIQEYHMPVYHALCAAIESEFFMDKD